MTTVTVSGFKIRKSEKTKRIYGTYVRYALYKATMLYFQEKLLAKEATKFVSCFLAALSDAS